MRMDLQYMRKYSVAEGKRNERRGKRERKGKGIYNIEEDRKKIKRE